MPKIRYVVGIIAAIHRTTGRSRLVFLDGTGNDQVTYTSQLVVHDFLQFCQVDLPFSGPLKFSESELYEFDFEKMLLTFLAIINANYKNYKRNIKR